MFCGARGGGLRRRSYAGAGRDGQRGLMTEAAVAVTLGFAAAWHPCAGVISGLCGAERDGRSGPVRSGSAIAPADCG